jgi:hypothetical protein
MTRMGAVLLLVAIGACGEPKQLQPTTPEPDPESRCSGKPVRAPVAGYSPRDIPEDEEGYGYEFADNPLCAEGGIMPPPLPSPRPQTQPSAPPQPSATHTVVPAPPDPRQPAKLDP